MKLSLLIILSLGLALSPLCALDSTHKKSMQNTSLSQTDAEFLFATNASHLNIVALSDEEMEETEGEGFFTSFLVSGALSLVKYGVCRLAGKSDCSFMAKGKHSW